MNTQKLQEIGLNKNEAEIYLNLISRGESSANEIIKSTGHHRNIVYDNLDKLIERGLVTYVFVGKKRIFRSTKATALVDMIQLKESLLQEQKEKASILTSEIQKMLRTGKSGFKTNIFLGVKGIKEILSEILEEKEYWGIGVSNSSVQVLGKTFWENYIQKIKQKNLKENLLLNSDFHETVPITVPKKTFVRYLPEQFNLITEILIYGNKVAIIVYTKTPVATVMEDKNAVDSFKSYFNTLWKNSKTLK